MMYNMCNNNDNKWIIINECQKFPEETFLGGIQSTVFKNNFTSMKRICTAYNKPMHCKDRQVLRDIFSINQKMVQKWHLWQELLKSTSKIWKPSYGWMTWCRQQSEDINCIVMEYLNLWPILEAKVLLELIS